MEQVTVRVSESTRRRLEARAQAEGLRISDIVRRAIERDLAQAETTDTPLIENLRDLIGCLESGVPDLGQRHSEYLKEIITENAR